MEIIQEYSRKYDFFNFIRYPKKSENWLQAYCRHAVVLRGDYVLSIGADDVVYPGFFEDMTKAAMEFPGAGVIYANHDFISHDMRVLGTNESGVTETRFLIGEPLCRQLCKPKLFETGVGSLIRGDLFRWLIEREFFKLGPWFDSMGYVAASLRSGAVYVPKTLSGFTIVQKMEPSYHQRVLADEERCVEFFREIRSKLRSAEFRSFMPGHVASSLESKALSAMVPSALARIAISLRQEQIWGLLNAGKFHDALGLARQLVADSPDSVVSLEQLGASLLFTGAALDAESVFSRAIELDPSRARLHEVRSICLKSLGRDDEADVSHRRAVALDPAIALDSPGDAAANIKSS